MNIPGLADWPYLCTLTALLTMMYGSASAADHPIDFNRDIRPILAENCYKCHGPDTRVRKGNLRLDLREDAFRDRDGHAVIVPSKPDDSALIDRITATEADVVMPPTESGKSLTKEQVALLKKWVETGAQWDGHWAYLTPKRPQFPTVENESRVKNPVDRFILGKVEEAGLTPGAEADRPTLIRRLSLDLLGLPPTPAEVDAFVRDESPNAYEKVVDRLLSNPHFGERMAQDWLDVSRYADTNGYHIDNHRDIWKWRDWVINAFNNNLRFDTFVVEQLAGDLLPNATIDQKIATGFNRNTMVNFEGGADPAEYLTKYIVDRVNTTATVFLGTTLACAECHDHKYDPFTQRDFYAMYAFFHNVPEQGLDGNKISPAPRLKVPAADQMSRLAEVRAKLAKVNERLAAPHPVADVAQLVWERKIADTKGKPDAGWSVVQPIGVLSRNGATLTAQPDGSYLASGLNPDHDVYELIARTDAINITAIRLEALTHPSFTMNTTGRSTNGNFVLTTFETDASPLTNLDESKAIAFAKAEADYEQKNGGFLIGKSIDADSKTGWAVDGDTKRENRAAVFVAKEAFGGSGGTLLRIRLKFESQFAQHVIGRFRIAITTESEPGLKMGPPAKIVDLAATYLDKRTEAQTKELRDYFRQNIAPEFKADRVEFVALTMAEKAIDDEIPHTMVMEEMPQPRKTFMLIRGDFRSKGDEVTAAVPASLPPLPTGEKADRLGLARWLVDPGHPLTARVTVNRFWQHYFGTGLVKTTNDFGSQGDWPTHPELLDWLAREFVDGGWDVKAFQKLLVMSATYRQETRVTKEKLERDPYNRLLARGPRFRLDAEAIRDQTLSVAGLLNDQIGGRSVYPYQPAGLWEEVSFGGDFSSQKYSQSKGTDLYRRGMYTYWKRAAPHPALTTFDAPNRELCTTTRARTNTPLQALVLMNDPAAIEAARHLGARQIREGGTKPEERLTYAFRLCIARAPKPREVEVLTKILVEELERYRKDPEAAKALLKVGEAVTPGETDPAEHAAWTAISNILLNLDEMITKG